MILRGDIEIIIPSESENQVLNRKERSFIEISEMSQEERAFINSLVLSNRPLKLKESCARPWLVDKKTNKEDITYILTKKMKCIYGYKNNE
ncbi:MAG: hypothetical protein Ta2B_17230 [Termitinemataceae bacterium]|nr:MAG: hypothetical protein Ta2B_17230 [Termitinemataceae bacterium]